MILKESTLTLSAPHYTVVPIMMWSILKKFIHYHIGIENVFLSENEIAAIRKSFKEREVIEKTCFTEFGQIENVSFNFMQYYQREVGINGPMHTLIDEPVNILSFSRNYILWNGYHRSLIKIINGERSVQGYVFELVIE